MQRDFNEEWIYFHNKEYPFFVIKVLLSMGKSLKKYYKWLLSISSPEKSLLNLENHIDNKLTILILKLSISHI